MSDEMAPRLRADLVRDLYKRYVKDPASVDESWRPFFDGLDGIASNGSAQSLHAGATGPHRASLVLGRLIESYRWRGHLGAQVDPLRLSNPGHDSDLVLDRLALSADLGLAPAEVNRAIERLEAVYCGTIGFEFMHVGNEVAREWLRNAIETGWGAPDRELRRVAAERLIEADEFEQFMQRQFTAKKRFGAEGAESLIPWLWVVLAESARLGVRTAVLGGTARGRLNQMANVAGRPLHKLLAEFRGGRPFPADVRASGDVTYHLGHAGEQQFGSSQLRIDYCSNPSHLEAINAVALGRTAALQARYADASVARREVMCLMVHTDAAFAGQGVVAEVLQLSGLDHYSTGGSIHVIINNQIGFTTEPSCYRTSAYCSDVAKTIGAPILHVNGDDVDAVVRAATLAAEYRHRFGNDIVIDLVCYRRRGHNELDEPTFTQPELYRSIAAHPPVRRIHLDSLRQSGDFPEAEEDAFAAAYRQRLKSAHEAAKSYKPNHDPPAPRDAHRGIGEGAEERTGATGLPMEHLRHIGRALSQAPADMAVNPKISRVLADRTEALRSGEGIDWALAEALALGSLLCDGMSVRLSGQDTVRGAFSHRHFILHDQGGGRAFSLFDALPHPRARCEIINSPLAEYATLGFEYGYSLDADDSLVVWEAQFGDFANVAQVVIDQFISSGEDKWRQCSGLVLLLPHGLEGQGPEHSSARIERYLQMCAAENMVVINCTTPANYFHALRRQRQPPRRPLVIFTPKSLLRRREVFSPLADLGPGTAFQPVVGPRAEGGALERVVLCSGKVYWDLEAERQRHGLEDVGLVRLEQLYPFPDHVLESVLRPYGKAEFVWCQEEPQNMGAWTYVDRRVSAILHGIGAKASVLAYFGRPENPSPAIGTTAEHDADQLLIVKRALGLAGSGAAAQSQPG